VHASIVSSANRILNRCMREKSMGAKDVVVQWRCAGKNATEGYYTFRSTGS
jgi:hypothetical protein